VGNEKNWERTSIVEKVEERPPGERGGGKNDQNKERTKIQLVEKGKKGEKCAIDTMHRSRWKKKTGKKGRSTAPYYEGELTSEIYT